MIFVTVGTHHQPFDRLLQAVADVDWQVPVVVQGGPCGIRGRDWRFVRSISPEDWHAEVERARVVITHAGPASIVGCLRAGRVPIVVPRRALWREHVDEHQVAYAHRIRESVHLVEDVALLQEAVRVHDDRVAALANPWDPDGTERFATSLGQLVEALVRPSTNGR